MTETPIQQAAERVAREFLNAYWSGERVEWIAAHSGCAIPDPEPSWPFFGALWDECERRGWWVQVRQDETVLHTLEDGLRDFNASDPSDPREALIRCVEQWLDAQGENG